MIKRQENRIKKNPIPIPNENGPEAIALKHEFDKPNPFVPKETPKLVEQSGISTNIHNEVPTIPNKGLMNGKYRDI